MKLYDINVFDWGIYNDEGQSRVCLDAYPVERGADGYYDTDTSVDPIRLELTEREVAMLAFDNTNDTWIHSTYLAAEVDRLPRRVYDWLKDLHEE